jgi:hypothetical protein
MDVANEDSADPNHWFLKLREFAVEKVLCVEDPGLLGYDLDYY